MISGRVGIKICKCGEEISDARYALGIYVCLDCGEEKASLQKEKKSKRLVILYSKGGYQYLNPGAEGDLKQNAKRTTG